MGQTAAQGPGFRMGQTAVQAPGSMSPGRAAASSRPRQLQLAQQTANSAGPANVVLAVRMSGFRGQRAGFSPDTHNSV